MQDITPLLALGFSATIADRLNAKLVRSPNGCLEWTGASLAAGHGHMSRGSQHAGYESTHRVAWMLEHGPIPDGLFVCHRCDNPPCCDPAHLFLGTAADNSHDMWNKGRGPSATLIPKGAAHPDARLSDDEVAQMRNLYPEVKNYAEIGRRFGVSKQHARSVILGTKRKP